MTSNDNNRPICSIAKHSVSRPSLEPIMDKLSMLNSVRDMPYLVLGDVWKTSIFFNSDVFDVFFFSFFQNISYVNNAFENHFSQLKRNKNSYRFSHFLKNIKNAFKNQFPRAKLNKNLYTILHFLKNKICDIL